MLCVIARPLLFASIDEAVAAARGVPVRALGFVFLALVGVTAAAATQAVGALLLLGLLAAPAGAAQRLTARPFLALWLSAGIAVASMWIGLSIAYAAPSVPPSFAILAVATTGTFAASAVPRVRALRRSGGFDARTAPTGRHRPRERGRLGRRDESAADSRAFLPAPWPGSQVRAPRVLTWMHALPVSKGATAMSIRPRTIAAIAAALTLGTTAVGVGAAVGGHRPQGLGQQVRQLHEGQPRQPAGPARGHRQAQRGRRRRHDSPRRRRARGR